VTEDFRMTEVEWLASTDRALIWEFGKQFSHLWLGNGGELGIRKTSTISSRTPGGVPNRCPICNTSICIEPSHPQGDAPCPNCGTLLWFFNTSAGMRFYESKAIAPLRDKVLQRVCEELGVNKEQVTPDSTLLEDEDIAADSLDIVEFVMKFEEAFGVSIPDEEAENINTVGDAIDYLAKRQL
jgi:acyl carrier protein